MPRFPALRGRPLRWLALVVLALPSSARAEARPLWVVVMAPAHEDALWPLCRRRGAQGYEVVRVVLGSEDAPRGDARRLRERLAAIGVGSGDEDAVLLVGAMPTGTDAAALEDPTVVPALTGTMGRMAGKPTDLGYGRIAGEPVAVGRFPARSAAEARAMVAKTIAFEEARDADPWRRRITLLVGHPGGSSQLQRRLGAQVVGREVDARLAALHPRWDVKALVHLPPSPFTVPGAALPARSLDAVRQGQLFTVYLGHSGAAGLWSDGTRFLAREDWGGLETGPAAGILLSCGCYTCQLDGFAGEGFGFAALRNPAGPVAVVGAQGESYGAMGKLAFEGLVPLLGAAEPPDRLGAWWLAMQRGLAQGSIGLLTFQLYDRADGSGGTVPLATQREEHLEMWTLLGDPALRLPLLSQDLQLDTDGQAAPGSTLLLRGSVPAHLRGAPTTVHLTVERPLGALPASAAEVPAQTGAARDAALLARHAQANDRAIVEVRVAAQDGRFEARLVLPAALPWEAVTVRALAVSAAGGAQAALVLPVAR